MTTVLHLLPFWAPMIAYLFLQDGIKADHIEAEARNRGLLK